MSSGGVGGHFYKRRVGRCLMRSGGNHEWGIEMEGCSWVWRVGRGDGLMRGEVIEPTSNGGEERGRVGIGCGGNEGIEFVMARGGANDVQCGPLGIALVGDSCRGVLRRKGLRDVGVAGRTMGIKVGGQEEKGGAGIAAARPSDRGEGVGGKGGE